MTMQAKERSEALDAADTLSKERGEAIEAADEAKKMAEKLEASAAKSSELATKMRAQAEAVCCSWIQYVGLSCRVVAGTDKV